MEKKIKYSIIVATFNRLDELQELLVSAENLDFSEDQFEVLIADDGSTDSTQEYFKNRQSSIQIRYIRQHNQGPGEARNFGMRHANGEYFIFVDSDCLLPPKWLKVIDQALSLYKYDAFGGPDTYHESFSDLLKAINYSMTSFIGTGGTRGSKKSVAKFYPRSFNMGIHKKIFDNIGGMNKLRHGQDMDFSARIYQAGYNVGLIPEAYVYHKRRTSLWKFFKQVFNWGVARINLGRTHPSLLKAVHFLPSLIILSLIVLLIVSFFLSLPKLWSFVFYCFIGICLVAFIQSFFKYRSLNAAFLSILTLNIQVFAYGAGLLWALLQTGWKKEARGFTKNYYGKN